MKILIIDPVGGISGDMLLAGLISLGCPVDHLREVLGMLPVGPFTLQTCHRSVNGIDALNLLFTCGDTHEVRTYGLIRDTILVKLPDPIRSRADAVFRALAAVEASVHGMSVEDVHFHEVGAVDSILDIVGIAAAIEILAPDEIYCRTVPLGTGTTESMHGTIPLPAPATVRLLEGRSVRFTDIASELTTPTGAAAVSALALKGSPRGDLVLCAVGYGCGSREITGWPNLCRTILCETGPFDQDERTYAVEADIDDMSPEDTEAALARIFDSGARDAGITSRIMKRGRPGFSIHAVCAGAELEKVMASILMHTTTIGVRYYSIERRVLERSSSRIATSWGDVRVKECILPDGTRRIKPEYRDLAEIAEKQRIPVPVVRAEVERIVLDNRLQGDQPEDA